MPRDTRQNILDAARDLFAQKGYEGVSVREICAAAGVSDNGVHYHFKSKKSLYRAVLQRFVERRLTSLIRIVAEGPRDEADFRTRLRIFVEENLAAALEDPAGLRIAFRELEQDWLRAGDEIFAAIADHAQALARFIALAQEAGMVRAAVDPGIVVGTLLDRIGGQVRHAEVYKRYWGTTIEDPHYRRHWVDQTIDLIFLGILAPEKGETQ